MMKLLLLIVTLSIIANTTPAAAQAPAPDLSGVWMRLEPSGTFSQAAPLMTPWAMERFARNKPTIGPKAVLDANDPTLDCDPPGVPYLLVIPTPFELIQIPGQIVQLFEYNHFVRRIHMDGRGHPADLADTGSHEWLGHSVGSWDGGTLVIDTVGFNDKTWLDRLGHPHSDQLHVIERVRRLDRDTLDYRITIDDPKAYTRPWEGQMTFGLKSGWSVLEHHCTTTGDAYLEYKQKAWDKALTPNP